MHQLSRVVDFVLYELTVGFRHAVHVEVFHGHQIAALVVFAQKHDRSVRETRTQHRAHRVLFQVWFKIHTAQYYYIYIIPTFAIGPFTIPLSFPCVRNTDYGTDIRDGQLPVDRKLLTVISREPRMKTVQ